jgi:hypothetical protein
MSWDPDREDNTIYKVVMNHERAVFNLARRP